MGLGHRRTPLQQLLVVVLVVAGLADQPLALVEDVVQLVAITAAGACPGAAGRRLLAEQVQFVEGFRVGLAHALELDSESVVKVQQAFVRGAYKTGFFIQPLCGNAGNNRCRKTEFWGNLGLSFEFC